MQNSEIQKCRIHLQNKQFSTIYSQQGVTGSKYSHLINKLSRDLNQCEKKQRKIRESFKAVDKKMKEISEADFEKIKKYDQLEKQNGLLVKEVKRMSGVVSTYKSAKVEVEEKYGFLLTKTQQNQTQFSKLEKKYETMTNLNDFLIQLVENTLQYLPKYEGECEKICENIISMNKSTRNLKGESEQKQELRKTVSKFIGKISFFKDQVKKVQKYQELLRHSISDAHLNALDISKRIFIIETPEQLCRIKMDIQGLRNSIETKSIQQIEPYVVSQRFIANHNLELCLKTVNETVHPYTSRIEHIFQELTLMFDHQIHLLQTQKMEFQFSKNKKLLKTYHTYECEICQIYEKIIKQVFSIVRETSKQIKFQFLKEIKQINDASEISLLI